MLKVLDQSLKSSEIILCLLHIFLTEELGEVADKSVYLVTDKREVKCLKLTEYLVGKNVVKSVNLGSATRYVCGNEITKLLNYTVTERQAEMLDNVVIKLCYLIK